MISFDTLGLYLIKMIYTYKALIYLAPNLPNHGHRIPRDRRDQPLVQLSRFSRLFRTAHTMTQLRQESAQKPPNSCKDLWIYLGILCKTRYIKYYTNLLA